MKLKPSRPIELEWKANQGRIWLKQWLQNLVKTGQFGLVQIFKIRSKFDEFI
jgi:hypothetical protein